MCHDTESVLQATNLVSILVLLFSSPSLPPAWLSRVLNHLGTAWKIRTVCVGIGLGSNFASWGLVCSWLLSGQEAPLGSSLSPVLFGHGVISHPPASCRQSLWNGFGQAASSLLAHLGCGGVGDVPWHGHWGTLYLRVMETAISPGKSLIWKAASSKLRQLPESGQAFMGNISSRALPLPNLQSSLQNMEMLFWEKISNKF